MGRKIDSFVGKNVWVIGATHGIGNSLCRMIAKDSKQLIISSRTKQDLEKLASSLATDKVVSYPIDLIDFNSVSNALSVFSKKNIYVDIVIFASGFYEPMRGDNIDKELCLKTININHQAVMASILDFLSYYRREKKEGHLVIFSSVSADYPLPGSLAYGASKASLSHFCQSLYYDVEKENIYFHIINPGFVESRLTEKNKFKMPFIISADKAASYTLKGLKSGKLHVYYPLTMRLVFILLKIIPNFILLYLMKKKS